MPEMSTGQAIKKALSLCLDNYEEAFLAGEDIGISVSYTHLPLPTSDLV